MADSDEQSNIRNILGESKNVPVIGITKDAKKGGNYVSQVLGEKRIRLFGVDPLEIDKQPSGCRRYYRQ
jgi:predicted CoA-binding protein